MALLPSYRSAAYLITPRILLSDRDNTPGPDITRHVTRAVVDADIDRAGPKGRIELSASRPDVLPADAWVAPYLDIVPETGEPQSAQMGLYTLGEPRVTWDGMGGGFADNVGDDIIALLDRATMTDAQTTNANINIMGEVRRSIQIATMATFGRNIFPYTLLRPKTDWGSPGSDSSGFVGTDGLSTQPGRRPRGDYSWFVQFQSGSPAGAYRYLNAGGASYRFPIPDNATHIYSSHYRHCTHQFLTTKFEIRFYDEAGAMMSQRVNAVANAPEATGVWLSWIDVGEIPDGAVSMGVLPIVFTTEAITAGMDTVTAHLGGFEVGVACGDPLTRDALPDDTRNATTAISHPAGTRWLERINDLLAAIDYHALIATPDGRPTTRRQRDPRTDTAARSYDLGRDVRVTGDIVTDRSRDNIYNQVVGVKEDWATGTALVAVASNDDPDHPWSTINMGVIGPREPLVMSDAVDQDALQALADAKLARASMQENIHISLLPDPTLGVHDIIEITGSGGPVAGKWAIESIRWGLTADDPLVAVGARRTVTTQEASL